LYGLRNPFRFSIDHATGICGLVMSAKRVRRVDMLTQCKKGQTWAGDAKKARTISISSGNCPSLTLVDPIYGL